MVAAVEFERVSRRFGAVHAVDSLSFRVQDGEFFSMLGPSGSGKTTCLRLIAGFERPDEGRIRLHGASAQSLPPYQRDVNTVFQDYALFPHMTVARNVAYSLMVKGVPGNEQLRRAEAMLDLVKLSGLSGRKPAQLSGGQRQRVALARALISQPRVLLLDEPLGALDLKLREQMQVELKALQRQLGITFIYVTHDQEEALSMSDRLAVFNHGRIEQIGVPEEVYDRPATAFVASFVGFSNIIDAATARMLLGSPAAFSIRPERIRLEDDGLAAGEGACRARGTVSDIQYHGASTRYQVQLEGGTEIAVIHQNTRSSPGRAAARLGQPVTLTWEREDIRPLHAPGA